jgi:DnaK suppressor protein
MTAAVKERITRARAAAYRRQIEAKVQEVRAGLSARRAAEFVSRPEEPLDFGDCCQKSHDEWLFLNQNRLELALLRDLQAALARLDGGSFGICPGCGEVIAEKRLDAVPWATLCMSCEEKGPPSEDAA